MPYVLFWAGCCVEQKAVISNLTAKNNLFYFYFMNYKLSNVFIMKFSKKKEIAFAHLHIQIHIIRGLPTHNTIRIAYNEFNCSMDVKNVYNFEKSIMQYF